MKKLSFSAVVSVILSILFVLPSFAMLHGDADCDGEITTSDARLALRMAVGLESPPLYNADADADGRITEADARLLLRVALGMESIERNHIFLSGKSCIICGVSADAKPSMNSPLKVDGKVLNTGIGINDVCSLIGSYDRADENFSGITAYSFIKEGSYLVMAFAKNDKVFAYYVCGNSVSLNGVSTGDVPAVKTENFSDGTVAEYFTDKNDNGRTYAFFISDSSASVTIDRDAKNSFEATSVQIFNMTNAFRAQYNKTALKWNSEAARVSALHSTDMADNNYFDHYNLKNMSPADRASAAGISFYRYAENIAAGNSLPYRTIDQWVNSAGHRSNILNNIDQLGVGGAYNPSATYQYYWTQNFLSQ